MSGVLAVVLSLAPLDQLKVIGLLLLSVPLSLVFPYLPSSRTSVVPHLFSIVPAIVYLWFVLGLRDGCLHLLASSMVTWGIMKVGSRTGGKGGMGKRVPWMVFGVVMGHLVLNDVLHQLYPDKVDSISIASSHMVLCMKLISFAWSVYDGSVPDEKLDATQRSSKLDEIPGIIPFLGYCFFFPSIIAGPSFTYSSYDSFMTHDLFLKEIYGNQFGFAKMLDPGFVTHSFAYRFGYLNLAAFLARTKYYAIWCLAESAFIISGFGYNPLTKKYDASRNVRIRSIEFPSNLKVLLESWNMNTNVWLKECVYKRVAKEGKKPGFKSTQITFFTSAIWHGVNPCYTLTFVFAGFAQSVARQLRKVLRPWFLPPTALSSPRPPSSSEHSPSPKVTPHVDTPRIKLSPPRQSLAKWVYDILGSIVALSTLNFSIAPFMLLNIKDSLKVWAAVNHYGLYLVMGSMILLQFGGASLLKQGLRKREKSAAKRGEVEMEEERKRVEWEGNVEKKRVDRGEGVASLGLDVEELVEEEERERLKNN